MKIKKDDNIIVITGKDKGKTGKVLRVFPKKDLVLVSGINKKKKHARGTKSGQKGQIIEIDSPLHISNVMMLDGSKRTRIGFKINGDKKVRVSKKTGKEI